VGLRCALVALHEGQRVSLILTESALRSLYTVETGSTAGAQEVQWFQFERDVQSIMSSLGFAVEHAAAARSGDDGVDVYARKGTDLEEVSWLIQCKCYSAARKVGPATVRELVGALEDHPAGVRGMIVTTSRFSSGAR
jgi:restriction endonuclease Mrr